MSVRSFTPVKKKHMPAILILAINKTATAAGQNTELICDPSGSLYVGHTDRILGSWGGVYTRPADTTAYAANDCISVSSSTGQPGLTWASASRSTRDGSDSGGYVTFAGIYTSKTLCTARFRLHLYYGYAARNDNLQMYFTGRFVTGHFGTIDFPACTTEGALDQGLAAGGASDGISPAYAYAVNQSFRIPYLTDNVPLYTGTPNSLYGILTTQDAFTPDSAQVFYVTLGIERS